MDTHTPSTRTTRIVCVSDTHNASPLNGTFKLPKGDVLIHAGDMTNQGSISELRKTVEWIEKADFEAKIVIAGNHDITLDTEFYAEYGSHFHNQRPEDPVECCDLLINSKSIVYLSHQSAKIRLTKDDGPRTTFKVFGSPYSPSRGLWAFGYGPEEAGALWDQIPLDTDILITHTPPKYHCDESPAPRGSSGCEKLREALWRVRPRIAVCGHIHEAQGFEWVRWDLHAPNIKYKEESVTYGINYKIEKKKEAVIDLTSKSGCALENDGSVGDKKKAKSPMTNRDAVPSSFPSTPFLSTKSIAQISSAPRLPSQHHHSLEYSSCYTDEADPQDSERDILSPATRGQGGTPPSGRCDLEALSGRMGRKETFVINAAMTATSWPHKSGKSYNKPIVIDVELPVWDQYSPRGRREVTEVITHRIL